MNKEVGNEHKMEVFIQEIYDDGSPGVKTVQGYFDHRYWKVFPLYYYSKVFIFGISEDRDTNVGGYWHFTREIVDSDTSTLGVKMAESGYGNYWEHEWDAITPLPNSYIKDYYTCFFMHASAGNSDKWAIKCISHDGTLWQNDHGQFDHGWQQIVAFRTKADSTGQTYIFGHRSHIGYGQYFIWKVNNDSTLAEDGETDGGNWDNYYDKITIFKGPDEKFYVFGLDKQNDYLWFIQHVSDDGVLAESALDGGNANCFYDQVIPIEYNHDKWAHPDQWMSLQNSIIGTRTLSQIALPGSHDTGMSASNINGCYLGHSCNTETQYEDMAGQLALGARFFDIRPMIDDGQDGGSDKVTTGHATKFGNDTAGCRGESKESILNALQNFFADAKHSNELVILRISHCMYPPGQGHGDCTVEQQSEFAHAVVNGLEDRGVKVVKGEIDLKSEQLNDLLKLGNVIVVAHNVRDRDNGIYLWGYGDGFDYYIYDEYSNTEKFKVMTDGGTNNSGDPDAGQIAKLLNPDHHSSKEYNGFLLSWTLTLTDSHATDCPSTNPRSIVDMSLIAEPRINEYMKLLVEDGVDVNGTTKKITKTLFPNILFVDIFDQVATHAAMYLNESYDNLDE